MRRISEGAAFIRTKGEAGTGNVVEAVRHQRAVMSEVRKASVMNEEELYAYAKDIQAPFHLLKETARLKRLPVVNFAAGGIATPGAYSSPCMRLALSLDSGRCAHDAARLRRRCVDVSLNLHRKSNYACLVFVGSGIFHVRLLAPRLM